jgi:hypothetical protein
LPIWFEGALARSQRTLDDHAENALDAWAFRVFGAGVKGFDNSGDSAARAEVADDFGPDGIAGFDDIVEDLVDDVLLEDAEVTVGEEIFLEGFELEAGLAGHVADRDATEVGKAGLGTDRGELGVVDEDLVGFELIAPGFDGRKFDLQAGFGVIVGVTGGFVFGFVLFAHFSILSGFESIFSRLTSCGLWPAPHRNLSPSACRPL